MMNVVVLRLRFRYAAAAILEMLALIAAAVFRFDAFDGHVRAADTKAAPEAAGDTWTWTAIDADTKLIASYLVGGRYGEYAM